jgi:hypothetical protein
MHIPKTGGTSIEDWLKTQKSFKEHLYMKQPPNGFSCTPQHLAYTTIRDVFSSAFPEFSYQFAIVRNPYERLESEFFYRRKLKQLRLGDNPEKYFSSWVCTMLKEVKKQPHLLDNHLRPQVEFISKEVEVFYFEDGISDIMNQVARKINAEKPHSIIHNKSSDRKPVYWSVKAINLVNDFYKNDFESLGYKHKPKTYEIFALLKDKVLVCAFMVRTNARSILRGLKPLLIKKRAQ